MSELNYLAIDLFLYDLGEGLGQDSQTVTKNRKRFWQRIYPNLTDEELEELKAKETQFSTFIKLFNPQKKFISFPEDELNGYYYPVKIGDTYGVQVDYSGLKNAAQENNLTLSERLPKLKQTIIEHLHNIRGQMGETWLIWGQINEETEENEKIAQDCYYFSNIVPQKNWKQDLKGQGKINEAYLFELSKPDLNPDGINKTHHVIICLFPSHVSKTNMRKTIGKLQRNLLQLLSYHHKILWVYEQSRQLKQTLKKISATIQPLIHQLDNALKEPQVNLNNLQTILSQSLSIAYNYQIQLTYLEEQYSSISINLNNYGLIINRLENEQSDLELFNQFTVYVQEKYLKQIKSDQQSLQAPVKPLETFINTVEGIINIENTKNERRLNNTIALASVGISTASVAASLLTGNSEKILQTFLTSNSDAPPTINPSITFIFSFTLSIMLGLLSVRIVWQGWLKNKS